MKAFETQEHRLPTEYVVGTPDGNYAYGAMLSAAKYCDLASVPHPPCGQWLHRWVPSLVEDQAEALRGENIEGKNTGRFYVAREDQAEALRAKGCERVEAIGHAVSYLPPADIPRLPDSLLVMPSHRLFEEEDFESFVEYLDVIEQQKESFRLITVCLSASIMAKPDWLAAVEARGMVTAQLPLFSSMNGYQTLQWLGTRFEFVTANALGAGLVLAAYAGAKVSLSGKVEPALCPGYGHDEVCEKAIRIDAGLLERELGFLCVEPAQSEAQREWAASELGVNHRLSPQALRAAFRWPGANVPELRVSGESASFLRELSTNVLGSKELAVSMEAGFFPVQEAAFAGNAQAQYLLGMIYRLGLFYDYCDELEALKWFERAAQQGHAEATLYGALCLLEGDASMQVVDTWLAQAEASGVKEVSSLRERLSR